MSQTELLRQQALLRVLWRADAVAALLPHMHAGVERGVAAYRANAGASAERALALAYPTVQQLLGEAAFGQLARALWQREPPEQGDLAGFGAGLPAFIQADAQLAGEPYLADTARLDWAVHQAVRAADAPAPSAAPLAGLGLLATADPAALRVQVVPGTALLRSPWPVVTIWQAHRSADVDFEPVRQALAAQQGELAWVWRTGWAVRVCALSGEVAAFNEGLLAGKNLAQALDQAGAAFDFSAWLQTALREQWLAQIDEDQPSP